MNLKIVSYVIVIISLNFLRVNSINLKDFQDNHPLLKFFQKLATATINQTTVRLTKPKDAITSSVPFLDSTIEDFDDFYPTDEFQVFKMRRNEKFIPPACKKKKYFCVPESRFRNLDGSCNNLIYPEWGVPNSTYSRLLPAKYHNGRRSPRRSNLNSRALPNARKIRVQAFPDGQVNNTLWNNNAMLWGQFMAHDMSLLKQPDNDVECCPSERKYKKGRSIFCYPIKVLHSDPTMGKAGIRCLNFTRTFTDKDFGCSKKKEPAQQISTVTSWLDLSNVYGMSKEMSDDLRTFRNGFLATEVRNGHIFPPRETNLQDNCPCNKNNKEVCYKTGDSRSNQHPELAIMQTLFVREHNRISKELSKINPHWNDEKLFQESRRILIASYQRISYYEWLPIFLGGSNLEKNNITFSRSDFVNDYDEQINPAVINEHAHAAFRFFHTHIPGKINLFDSNRTQTGSLSLSQWFNRPQVIEKENNMIDRITLGIVTQNIEETDNMFVKEITDELFACGKQFGIDLKAADIQRDRDHALAYYHEYRQYCNLTVAQSFDDYSDFIPNDKLDILKNLYKDYRDVDLTVGGALERLVPGAQVGPTFLCIMNEQFARTRKSDRFWFENSGSGFDQRQLDEIRKASVSRMFCDNGDGIKTMQPIGFTLIFPNFNELKPCYEISSMNLSAWKE